jgi:hypothetical protein
VIAALLLAAAQCADGKSCYAQADALVKANKYKEALPLLERACDLGHQMGCGMAAAFYSEPAFGMEDDAKAAVYEEKSGAFYDNAEIFSASEVKRDRERQQRMEKERNSLEAAEQLCNEGRALSCEGAVELYVFTNPDRAYALAARAARAKPQKYYPFSGADIAQVLMRQGKTDAAHAMLERACKDGFWAGCQELAQAYSSARWKLPWDRK